MTPHPKPLVEHPGAAAWCGFSTKNACLFHWLQPTRGKWSALVGEVPIAMPAPHALVGLMKTHTTDEARDGKVEQQDQRHEPVVERWVTATLPRIEASMRSAEWRPGESAKRGYERAVEDWWWL